MLTIQLGFLLTLLRVIPYLAMQAWAGLRGQPTVTHIGKRSGLLARIYGLFYLVVSVLLLVAASYFFRTLLQAGAAALVQSLLAPFSLAWHDGVFVIGFGLVILAMFEGIVWFTNWRVPAFAANPDRRRKVRSYLDRHALVVVGGGILGLLGLPSAIALAGWLVFVYTLPPEPD